MRRARSSCRWWRWLPSPIDSNGLPVEWPDHIRSSGGVQHALRAKSCRRARTPERMNLLRRSSCVTSSRRSLRTLVAPPAVNGIWHGADAKYIATNPRLIERHHVLTVPKRGCRPPTTRDGPAGSAQKAHRESRASCLNSFAFDRGAERCSDRSEQRRELFLALGNHDGYRSCRGILRLVHTSNGNRVNPIIVAARPPGAQADMMRIHNLYIRFSVSVAGYIDRFVAGDIERGHDRGRWREIISHVVADCDINHCVIRRPYHRRVRRYIGNRWRCPVEYTGNHKRAE